MHTFTSLAAGVPGNARGPDFGRPPDDRRRGRTGGPARILLPAGPLAGRPALVRRSALHSTPAHRGPRCALEDLPGLRPRHPYREGQGRGDGVRSRRRAERRILRGVGLDRVHHAEAYGLAQRPGCRHPARSDSYAVALGAGLLGRDGTLWWALRFSLSALAGRADGLPGADDLGSTAAPAARCWASSCTRASRVARP